MHNISQPNDIGKDFGYDDVMSFLFDRQYKSDEGGHGNLQARFVAIHLNGKIRSASPYGYVIKNNIEEILSEIIDENLLLSESDNEVPQRIEKSDRLNHILIRVEQIRELHRDFMRENSDIKLSEDDLVVLYPDDTLLDDDYEVVFTNYISNLKKDYFAEQSVEDAVRPKGKKILTQIKLYFFTL